MSGLKRTLAERFQHDVPVPEDYADLDSLALMAGHASHRRFRDEAVPPQILRMLAAIALSTPTKSDLQQRDIILITRPDLLAALKALISDQPWTAGIPTMVVFCGNNRRQRQVHDQAGLAFANDHLDAFFNASVDAAIALAGFVTAAEAAGLACCPISAIRNAPKRVDDLLKLPDHVFPVAGLAVGWAEGAAPISQRLPLSTTLHENGFDDADFTARLADYDAQREVRHPYPTHRQAAAPRDGVPYSWSEDKARQYSHSERAGFGDYIRRKGFRLD